MLFLSKRFAQRKKSGGPLASPLCDNSPAPRAELQASRSEAFKTTSLLVVWRSFSFSPRPREWPPKALDPRFLHPAEAPAAISRKNAPKPRGAEPRAPPPGGGCQFYGGMKPISKFPLWPPRAPSNNFFWAPEAPNSDLGAIL